VFVGSTTQVGGAAVNTSLSEDKSFEISKREVWQAYERVKANKGAPGVDGVGLADFETDLKGNLYKVWNRMSSGSYFPPPVRAVPIPKPGGGVRMLGVPTIADRIAQTVVAARLEARVEPMFHPDSYGYRAGAVSVGRGGGGPAALLEQGLGGRSGHPGVLRQRRP
jgi:RNA-directed DNA polymerase